MAAYPLEQAQRSQEVTERQQEVGQNMAAMDALIINVLATQQPVLSTDLSMVKGLLVASRELWHIASEQRYLAHLTDHLGIGDLQLPPEVRVILPELRQALTESVAAFLHDDRVLADYTFERLRRLEFVLEAVPTPSHPPTLVPVLDLHLFALRYILTAAREIVRSAPLYRYVSAPY